ncbi:hypothetical protein, partial [Escherichia coli]|uniref:hypothetical protein n=1 Tax=Escherichia coli TaxID=562 RepID=UPI00039148DB
MGKGSSKGHTPREAKDNLKSTQLLSVIDAISEGPIDGPVDEQEVISRWRIEQCSELSAVSASFVLSTPTET